jgi:2-C-methyl-D-erythritol 4-phosphate cytidylyltransferase
MEKKEKVGVIIPAAGSGKRFGGSIPKQFLEIKSIPILKLAIQKFQECEDVKFIVISSGSDYINETSRLVERNNFTKVKSIVPGGEHRQDSVWNGIKEIVKYNVDMVLIHDAVRPFVSKDIIMNIIRAVREYDAAVPAVTPKDTIKISGSPGFLTGTLDRNKLYAVQTPQGFRTNLIVEAFEKAYVDKFYGTDDAALVERLGKKIKIVEGSYNNIKITTSEDYENASFILQKKGS